MDQIMQLLFTPNETVIKLLMIPMIFIDAFVSLRLISVFLSIKNEKKKDQLYILLAAVIGTISSFIIPKPFNTFANIILIIFLIKFIYNTTWLKALIAPFGPFAATIIFEQLVFKMLMTILNINLEAIGSVPAYALLGLVLIYTLMFLSYKLIKSTSLTINSLDGLNSKQKHSVIFQVIIGLIAICTQLIIVYYYIDILPSPIILISFISLLAYFIISLYSLSQTAELIATSSYLEESQLYAKTLTILYDNLRAFKHDFHNIIQSIGGYISLQDMNGLQSFYKEIKTDCDEINSLTVLNPSVVNNPAIYSLLASKYHKAIEKNITVDLEVFLDVSSLNIKTYELARILGILFDNAIEAASVSNDKHISFTIRKDFSCDRYLLILKNTYSNKDVNIEDIYKKGVSSKKGNTGLGLWEVRRILNKSNNLNLFTYKTDENFIQQFEIYQN